MKDGEICARLYSTQQPVRLAWEAGRISQMQAVEPSLAAGRWVARGLMDLQINGFAGIDFQADQPVLADLLHAVAGLRRAGCTQFLLTLMTDRWEVMLRRLIHLRAVRAASPVLQAAIAGWHLEGPFLSPKPGFHGAHNPDWMSDPGERQIRQLREITEEDPVLLTMAPERAGAAEAIALATALGIKVSLGHTDATADILAEAVRAGATGFTHLGNACPQALDRHDNIIWRALDTPGLTVSLIPDGYHVSPALFRLVHRALLERSIYYTTDAVSAAGAPPGRYAVGQHQVDVGPDQVVRQPGKTNYAGSGLSPAEGIFRAARMLARPWQQVWDFMSARPAAFMGLRREIEVGEQADLCVLEERPGGEVQMSQAFASGES